MIRLQIAFALIFVSQAYAQTLNESVSAYKEGNYALAFSGFKRLAERGSPIAQFNLGVCYDKGHGVIENVSQALYWIRKAADQGLPSAQFNLGLMYTNGRGVPSDPRLAIFWYRKAAEQGDAEAQTSIGVSYAKGQGVAKDLQQALFWFRKAADQGSVIAQFNLGLMFDGQGELKDFSQAFYWYRKAAEQGHVISQFNLGSIYFDGNGVPKDDQQAYFWWLLASVSGDRDASHNRNVVERRLTPEQRTNVQSMARKWIPKTNDSAKASRGANRDGSIPQPSELNSQIVTQPDSSGSGFRVAKNVFVTNNHVIENCARIRINGVAADVAGRDSNADLAWLRSENPGPFVKLRTQRIGLGESVAVAGYPLRGLLSGFNLTTGNLSSLSGIGGDTRLLQITAPVQPGNSGGPLLDSSGNLMGVVVSKLDAIKAAKLTGDIPQNVNFAINVNLLRSFLEAQSVDYVNANLDKSIPNTAIADTAKSFTVLVECWVEK